MSTFEDNKPYMDAVRRISSALKETADETGEKFAHAMMACDVLAEVLMTYPRDQRLDISSMMLTRLGNTLDRRWKKERQ